MKVNLSTAMCVSLPYLYVDEYTLNVLRLEKLFKRLHKVLHTSKALLLLSFKCVYKCLLACLCVCVLVTFFVWMLCAYEWIDLVLTDCKCVHTCNIDSSVSEYFSSVCLISCRQHSRLSTPVFCCCINTRTNVKPWRDQWMFYKKVFFPKRTQFVA